MNRMLAALLIVSGLVSCPRLPAQDGRLEKLRKDVRGDETAQESDAPKKAADSHDSSDPECDFWAQLCAEALARPLFAIGAAPFWLPHAALGDDLCTYRYFCAHPYQAGYPGYLVLNPAASAEWMQAWGEHIQPRVWAARLSIEDGNDFDGLNRLGGQALLETSSRFGVLANWNWYRERLPCGCVDQTCIGDINLTYRFAQSECAEMRVGLGARVLSDSALTDWGVNVHYGGDIFPVQPLVLSGAVDFGNLGSAFVVHTRASAGVLYRGWELFAGYDFLRVGCVNLQGPLVGLRFWF